MFDDVTQNRLHALPHSLKWEVLKMQNPKISANLNYFGTKMFLVFLLRKCLPTFEMFCLQIRKL